MLFRSNNNYYFIINIIKTFYYYHNDLRSGSMLPQMMKHHFYFDSASECRFSPMTCGRSGERTMEFVDTERRWSKFIPGGFCNRFKMWAELNQAVAASQRPLVVGH